jgi:ribosomal protein RSM22 (predicted rRNA methylase)
VGEGKDSSNNNNNNNSNNNNKNNKEKNMIKKKKFKKHLPSHTKLCMELYKEMSSGARALFNGFTFPAFTSLPSFKLLPEEADS